MTQKEFEERTGIKPTMEDFAYIHDLYMNTSMDKDEFCKEYMKSGDNKMVRDLHARLVSRNLKSSLMEKAVDGIIDFLIGKSRAYGDTDFRREAVRLVGETEVVKRTIEQGLPLWEEDRKHILQVLEEGKKVAG
jgi:hypothetical protein